MINSVENYNDAMALTIDVGLSTVKTAVFKSNGMLAALHETRNDAVISQGLCSNMNLSRLWELIREGTKNVLAQGVPATSITGVSLSGTGNGIYLVSEAGEDLLGITSMDRSADAVAKEWRNSPIGSRLQNDTVNHIWAGQPLPLLKHLKQEGRLPENFRLLFCKDWLRYHLTGEFVTDRSDASAAGLIDIKTHNWAEDSISAVGLRSIIPCLPKLVNSGEITGWITQEAAKETGISAGTPVFGGGIDLALAAMDDGLSTPELLHVTAGTWSINQQLIELEKIELANNCLQVIISPENGKMLLVDSSPSSAINIDILCTLTGKQFPDFKKWESIVNNISLCAHDPLYLPYPVGTWDMPKVTAGLYQIQAGISFDDIVKAVYDGIVLGHLRQIRKFQAVGKVERLVACGGLTRSKAWCQMLSNYSGLPLEISDNPHSSSRGAARIIFSKAENKIEIEKKKTMTYQPQIDSICYERIERFDKILKEIKKWT